LADADRIAHLDPGIRENACGWCWNLDCNLLRFEFDQRLISLDRLTR
jgi:hypothetical protein